MGERERQLRELAMNEQDAAALKIQGVARKRNAKNRVKRKRDAKRREEEMKDDGKEWTQEEQDAAKKIQGRQRMKRDKKRVKRKRDAKRREEEMKAGGKEWTQEEQDAAKKIQGRQRIKRDKQRLNDIRDGKRSAFESVFDYAHDIDEVLKIHLYLTVPEGKGAEGMLSTFKMRWPKYQISGTFKRDGSSVTLTPDEKFGLLDAVVECDDEGKKYSPARDFNADIRGADWLATGKSARGSQDTTERT